MAMKVKAVEKLLKFDKNSACSHRSTVGSTDRYHHHELHGPRTFLITSPLE